MRRLQPLERKAARIEGGILLALGGGIPISPYATTISFGISLVCGRVGGHRARAAGRVGMRG